MGLKVLLLVNLLSVELIECVVKCVEGVLDKNGVLVVEMGVRMGCFFNDCFIVKEFLME